MVGFGKNCIYRHALPPGRISENCSQVNTATPITPKLFYQCKKKKIGQESRELFLSNASLFVHDAEAYDNYQRQPDETEQIGTDIQRCTFELDFQRWTCKFVNRTFINFQ
ncbi:hypothetical protein MTR_6g078970 [Medicago truncatula]|uniref:Uncharacterized protein n=1 Tax=Medicago truncatula TaxID=3880 RepID=G7KL64_MEDTR|nr:hypothetical protein MTR_6g078970 [Medicago truncatula]